MERRPTCDVLWRRQRGSPSCDRPKPDFANGLSRLECCERTPRERPRSRAAEQRDELAAPHSITSSARASSVGGISRPSALAVLRLIVKKNRVGCSIGKSVGFVPFNILST